MTSKSQLRLHLSLRAKKRLRTILDNQYYWSKIFFIISERLSLPFRVTKKTGRALILALQLEYSRKSKNLKLSKGSVVSMIFPQRKGVVWFQVRLILLDNHVLELLSSVMKLKTTFLYHLLQFFIKYNMYRNQCQKIWATFITYITFIKLHRIYFLDA